MGVISLAFQGDRARGIFKSTEQVSEVIWTRMRAAASAMDPSVEFGPNTISTQWRCALELLRIHAALQQSHGFRFTAHPSAAERIQRFRDEVRAVRQASGAARVDISSEQIHERLAGQGWNHVGHGLKDYQLANLTQLVSVPNGANFSVPGAGKTTVSLALHLVLQDAVDCLLVVAPRNAFPAWDDVIGECLLEVASAEARAPILSLTGGEARISEALKRGGRRFIISYDQVLRVELAMRELLTRSRVHLILDESHKIKDAGGKRGRMLMRLGHLAVRRDILSGTPMPQSVSDLQSQVDFLWPGSGLGSRIGRGEPPRQVIQGLFVRTTKTELQLPPRERLLVPVTLTAAHLAFYSVLRDDVRAKASLLRRGSSGVVLKRARQSVMRLLQAAVNPEIVAAHVAEAASETHSALLRAVLSEGPSARVLRAVALARELATQGRKVLIWTIFTPTLRTIVKLLQDMQPAVIYGATVVGAETDDETRQGQIRRFKQDPACQVMVANPAAAAEGMSLHMVCHDAIYVDRSYNATHFLQSVDRIHRLGLPPDVLTRVHVLENALPFGVGSVDVSVARRLAKKIRAMEQLLQDPDLNDLALDEEDTDGALEESISLEDIDDLVRELEHGKGVPERAADFV